MSFLGSLVDAGVGIYNNERNLAFQQAAIDQNMALTRESWERDDNAIQRRVADLKAAGLNPILAAGSAAGNSNPIRVEPKKSDFKTDFGSSSIAEDIGKVQQIKHNKLLNQSAALQNVILEQQAEGYRLDNERKQLEINHFGETPLVKFASVILSKITGKDFQEWLEVLSGRSPDDPSSPSSSDPSSNPSSMPAKIESFTSDFLEGSNKWFSKAGNIYFTATGMAEIKDFWKRNLSGIMSYGKFEDAVKAACGQFYSKTFPGLAGAGFAGGGGSAW